MKRIITTLAIAIALASCSNDQPIEVPVYNLKVTNTGGSPECFISHDGVTRKYTTAVVNTVIEKNDVVTALGQSYSIDNQYNYGAANVSVVANITISINNEPVKSGINNLTFQL
jgi:hypothetical protein